MKPFLNLEVQPAAVKSQVVAGNLLLPEATLTVADLGAFHPEFGAALTRANLGPQVLGLQLDLPRGADVSLTAFSGHAPLPTQPRLFSPGMSSSDPRLLASASAVAVAVAFVAIIGAHGACDAALVGACLGLYAATNLKVAGQELPIAAVNAALTPFLQQQVGLALSMAALWGLCVVVNRADVMAYNPPIRSANGGALGLSVASDNPLVIRSPKLPDWLLSAEIKGLTLQPGQGPRLEGLAKVMGLEVSLPWISDLAATMRPHAKTGASSIIAGMDSAGLPTLRVGSQQLAFLPGSTLRAKSRAIPGLQGQIDRRLLGQGQLLVTDLSVPFPITSQVAVKAEVQLVGPLNAHPKMRVSLISDLSGAKAMELLDLLAVDLGQLPDAEQRLAVSGGRLSYTHIFDGDKLLANVMQG